MPHAIMIQYKITHFLYSCSHIIATDHIAPRHGGTQQFWREKKWRRLFICDSFSARSSRSRSSSCCRSSRYQFGCHYTIWDWQKFEIIKGNRRSCDTKLNEIYLLIPSSNILISTLMQLRQLSIRSRKRVEMIHSLMMQHKEVRMKVRAILAESIRQIL